MNATVHHINRMFGITKNDNCPTLLRNMNRNDLPILFKEAGFKIGAEIGVHRGKFSRYMFKVIPGLHLKCVDMWEKNYGAAQRKLAPFNAELMKMNSMEGASKIKDGSLDFVYIDAGHDFDNAVMDIIKWAPKVRSGGIVAGHDYHHNYQYGVMEAVDAYTKCHSISQWFLTRDLTPNWFWVVK